MNDIAPMVMGLGTFAMIVWIVRLTSHSRARREALKVQQDLQTRLLDKFGTTSDLSAFLQTEAGERFLRVLPEEKPNAMSKILGSVQTGLVFSILGIAFLMLDMWITVDEPVFKILGVITFALGLGFLASSFVSYRLSKAMDLLPKGASRGTGDVRL